MKSDRQFKIVIKFEKIKPFLEFGFNLEKKGINEMRYKEMRGTQWQVECTGNHSMIKT
jgi:hypothetical protein